MRIATLLRSSTATLFATLLFAALALSACTMGLARRPRDEAIPAVEAPPPPLSDTTGAPPAVPLDRPEKLLAIEKEAAALYRVQSLLQWAVSSRGERSVLADTYPGHERLFSAETIRYVSGLLRDEDDPERVRSLRFLRGHLVSETVALETARFDDEISNAETTTRVKLEWLPEPVAYFDLDGLQSEEKDPARRARIQEEIAKVWRDVLNPIHERKEARTQALLRDLGYDSYVRFAEEYRMVRLKPFVDQTADFLRATDAIYEALLAEQTREHLKIEPARMRRSDIGTLSRSPGLVPYFPKDLIVPAFRHFLEGFGLGLTAASGDSIRIDDAPVPEKDSRASCHPIEPGKDVRVTVKPADGIPHFDTFFHEGGHAVHFGWTTTTEWEYQQLGNGATTEGYGELFRNVWGDPAWLERYRDFVRARNASLPEGARTPVLTDLDMAKVIRRSVFWNLYMIRRFGYAKLIYETILHAGPPGVYAEVYKGQTADLQKVYQDLFSKAYGFQLTPMEALRFRTDVDPYFYAADYARAYVFAAAMDEGLSRKFGAPWFVRPAAGKFLKEEIFRDGSRLQPDEALRLAGMGDLEYVPVLNRIRRLLDESERLRAAGTAGARGAGSGGE
jgi:hypothetical protein